MYYEFVRPCDDPILKRIELLGGSRYFLVCIGHLNYLYSEEKFVIDSIRNMLSTERVALHSLSELEMLDLLLYPETRPFHLIHGNKKLYNDFMLRNSKKSV